MDSTNKSDSPIILSQEERKQNMDEFLLLAGMVDKEQQSKTTILTRSRSKMKEELNIKPNIENLSLSKISKKELKHKKDERKLHKAKDIITLENFEEFVEKILDKRNDISREGQQQQEKIIIQEDAMKIFHEGVLKVVLNYLENANETLKARTFEMAMNLELKRLLNE